jgi:hypothetical protein
MIVGNYHITGTLPQQRVLFQAHISSNTQTVTIPQGDPLLPSSFDADYPLLGLPHFLSPARISPWQSARSACIHFSFLRMKRQQVNVHTHAFLGGVLYLLWLVLLVLTG